MSINGFKPFGKHHPHSVKDLAYYNPDSYKHCTLANPNRKFSLSDLRKNIDGVVKSNLLLFKDNFDIIVRFLNKETGINFSKKLLIEMLETFLFVKDRFLYAWITPLNIGYIFLYQSLAQNLEYQYIRTDSDIFHALSSEPYVKIENNQVLKSVQSPERLMFTFIAHETEVINSVTRETLLMRVFIDNADKKSDDILFEKKLIFDLVGFDKAIKNTSNSSRDEEKLKLAEDVFNRVLPNFFA